MRIRIDDPRLLPDLLEALSARVDAVVAQTGENELDVSLLGSRRDPFQRVELESRLRQWRLRHPRARVEIQE